MGITASIVLAMLVVVILVFVIVGGIVSLVGSTVRDHEREDHG